ncbi:NADH dehydrogenase (ubiquinone) complex I, assembly factor 6-like isoform X2 [Porites lutea]|uniref:NADH dehydrogenase (ubiquinone) complex I, assembly factor 6-like isoform X2 n=1 Tax=Porites lutea TaxID=51062 RepID=UPI003CC59C41
MAAVSNGGKYFVRFRWKAFSSRGKNLTTSTQSSPQSSTQYCTNLVRNLDYENFLCVLLLPKGSRRSVFAVRAFNIEVARIQDTVSDPNIGRMRLQFWRDSLDNIYQGNPPQQPVALELAEEKSIDNRPYDTADSLEEHGENTVSSVLYLILECLGVKDVQADHAASHLGKAIGVVTLLRATPFHGSRGKVYIPSDVMIKHGVSQEDIIRGRTTQAVKDVTYDLASLAHSHLSTAKSLMSKAPKVATRVFLPMVSCQAYLTKIQQADFNMFHSTLRERNHLLPLQLLKHAWTGL